jgi:hypothetical protein
MDIVKIIDERIKFLILERQKLKAGPGVWTRKRKASGIFHRIQELERLKVIIQRG